MRVAVDAGTHDDGSCRAANPGGSPTTSKTGVAFHAHLDLDIVDRRSSRCCAPLCPRPTPWTHRNMDRDHDLRPCGARESALPLRRTRPGIEIKMVNRWQFLLEF